MFVCLAKTQKRHDLLNFFFVSFATGLYRGGLKGKKRVKLQGTINLCIKCITICHSEICLELQKLTHIRVFGSVSTSQAESLV